MANPWENDAIVGQQPAQQQAPQFPGVVRGRERPADPVQEVKDRQDITKGELDIRAKELDIRQTEASLAAKELEQKLGKEAGFYLRSRASGAAFDQLDVGAEGQLRAAGKGVLPDSWMNAWTPEERQKAEAYMADFIAASLRYESGAAIPPEEFNSQARIFFPQAGDSAKTLEVKRQLRQNMIKSLELGAGPDAVAQVDEYLNGIAANTAGDEQDEAPPLDGEQGLGAGERISYEGETYDQEKARILAAQWDEMRNRGAGFQVAREGMTFGLLGESSGIGNAIGGILRGDFDVGENYRIGRDAEDILTNQAREELGWAATPIEVVAGGSGVLSRGGQVFNAGRQVAASGQPLTRQAVQNQMLRSATRDGAVVGATGGFGYGEGLEGSTVNALAGAALGAGAGYGGQRLGNALSNRSPRRDATELAQAGQAEGVTVNRAMADPNSNNAVSRADASIMGGSRVQREMQAIEGQLEEGVERLGSNGQALDRTATGDRIQRAGERVISDTRDVTNRKYQAAERMAGDTKIRPVRARTAAQTMIRDLSETANTNSAEITFLKGLAEDFQKPLSISALRDLRTSLRKKIGKGDLVFGQNEARVLQIMDEAAQDISQGLRQAGKANAASAFDAADTAYVARMDLIENTVQKLIGKRGQNLSAEQVASKFESMAKNDAEGLRKFWAQLDPTEKADVQATFAQALGRNNKGEFSPAIFLNNVGGAQRKMSERAIRIVFGKDGAQSVKNLQKLATEVNRVTGAMNSRTSKSGVATTMREWLFSLVGGGGLGAMSGNIGATAATAGVGLAAKGATEVLSARALMSPKIQKWLLQTPSTKSPKAIDAHFNRLGDIAKAEPALAGEIETLRKAILGAANDNAGSLAAENQNTEEGR